MSPTLKPAHKKRIDSNKKMFEVVIRLVFKIEDIKKFDKIEDLELECAAVSKQLQSLEHFIVEPYFSRTHESMGLKWDKEKCTYAC